MTKAGRALEKLGSRPASVVWVGANMDLKSNFKVVLFSHVDYQSMTAEVYRGDDFVALVSHENGGFQAEWGVPSNAKDPRYDLDALLEALAAAKDRLAECAPPETADRR